MLGDFDKKCANSSYRSADALNISKNYQKRHKLNQCFKLTTPDSDLLLFEKEVLKIGYNNTKERHINFNQILDVAGAQIIPVEMTDSILEGYCTGDEF